MCIYFMDISLGLRKIIYAKNLVITSDYFLRAKKMLDFSLKLFPFSLVVHSGYELILLTQEKLHKLGSEEL